MSAAPKLALVPASRYNCKVNKINMNVVPNSLGLKGAQKGTHCLKLIKGLIFDKKNMCISIFLYMLPQN